MSDGVKIELNIEEMERVSRALAALSVEYPAVNKALRANIRKVLAETRTKISKSIHSSMENDPRAAYRAVLHSVWKHALGGSVNILFKRKAGARYRLVRDRKLDPKKPGGNRLKRSADTERMDTYYGSDRGFVLRFLNKGTDVRKTRFGNRGSIRPRGVFDRTYPWFIDDAKKQIEDMVEDVVSQYFKAEMQE